MPKVTVSLRSIFYYKAEIRMSIQSKIKNPNSKII